jgi:hypothetical protein
MEELARGVASKLKAVSLFDRSEENAALSHFGLRLPGICTSVLPDGFPRPRAERHVR